MKKMNSLIPLAPLLYPNAQVDTSSPAGPPGPDRAAPIQLTVISTEPPSQKQGKSVGAEACLDRRSLVEWADVV